MNQAPNFFDNWPYKKMIAHRGAGKLAPENTLAAMRVGASFGYKMFEFDVKLSADAKSVLLHDDTLNRTSNGFGSLSALSLSELAQLDAGSWHSPLYAGETLATLSAVAAFLQANDLLTNIEIKPTIGDERRTGASVAFDAANLWKNAKTPPLLSSFSTDALLAAQEACPDLPRGHLFSDVLPENWLALCKSVGAVAFHANQATLTKEIIATAHAAKLRVLTYTVNDQARLDLLLQWGIDGIFTDRVDLFKPD